MVFGDVLLQGRVIGAAHSFRGRRSSRIKRQRRARQDADIAYRKEHRAGAIDSGRRCESARRSRSASHGLKLRNSIAQCAPCPCARMIRILRRKPAAPRNRSKRKEMQARPTRATIASIDARRSPNRLVDITLVPAALQGLNFAGDLILPLDRPKSSGSPIGRSDRHRPSTKASMRPSRCERAASPSL